ncbi:MAG: DNA repair protein RecN [Anaerolineales bacterium]|nr:DNA repair protein RecN [Anaerolineales bacterium]
MLTEIRIQNFAIIDQITLTFQDGLTILTGETGAGKSIIIDAVETLLGVRADTTQIRHGEDHSIVEGTFKLSENIREGIHQILNREELLDDPNYVILSREFRKEGRNVVRVNGRVTNLGILKELGDKLIDLHGQSEHLSLLNVSSHLQLLDRFAENLQEKNDYLNTYKTFQAVQLELRKLQQAEKDAKSRSELLAYQINEIESARLEDGEEDALKEERNRLSNSEKLSDLINQALVVLDDGQYDTPAITDLVGDVAGHLESLSRIDPTQNTLSEKILAISDSISDLTLEIRAYQDSLEFDPNRLTEVEERTTLIHDLKRKYGESVSVIYTYLEKAKRELDEITHAEERIEFLQEEENRLIRDLVTKADILSNTRKVAGKKLSAGIVEELRDLKMGSAKFEVRFQITESNTGLPLPDGRKVIFDENGFEQIEFMIETNPGEGLKPMVKIASGGETARLMLALKNVLTQADETPTLIFDEIDQGIGGRVGGVVGEKLWQLSRNHQVLCITHLAQLAGYGDSHYKVDKELSSERTTTSVKSIAGEERTIELAQMLGEVSEGTLRSAHEILQKVELYKKNGE